MMRRLIFLFICCAASGACARNIYESKGTVHAHCVSGSDDVTGNRCSADQDMEIYVVKPSDRAAPFGGMRNYWNLITKCDPPRDDSRVCLGNGLPKGIAAGCALVMAPMILPFDVFALPFAAARTRAFIPPGHLGTSEEHAAMNADFRDQLVGRLINVAEAVAEKRGKTTGADVVIALAAPEKREPEPAAQDRRLDAEARVVSTLVTRPRKTKGSDVMEAAGIAPETLRSIGFFAGDAKPSP